MMSVGVSSVQQGVFSTLGEYQNACGVLMSTLGGVLSTPEGYHEYTRGCRYE